MNYRYLIGAGVALATVLNWGDARAQLFGPLGPPVWYFGAEGGWTALDSQADRFGNTNTTIRQHFKNGYNAGARVGAEFGPWRLDEEFSHRQNDLGRLAIGNASARLNGDRRANAIMTNVLYDFGIGGWPVTPHIGAGIGAVELRTGAQLPNGASIIGGGTNWQFGYQGIAGIRYNINPSLAFDLDYWYLATDGASFRTRPNLGPVLSGVRVNTGYSSNSIVASLSLRFGVAPPPPPPAPLPPAPPPIARRVFLVFFDWDRDTITPDGMAIIQQAADAFRGGAPVQIMVTGYADRSGSPGYNQRLSERRANNVANALGRMGVPRQAMVVGGRGENDNRVPTADGVREPQNRRVEIVFP